MFYVYRFRLYPTEEQVEFLNRQIGHCRFVYNKLLEIAKESYEKERKKEKSGITTNTKSYYQNSKKNFRSSKKLTANHSKNLLSGLIERLRTSLKDLQNFPSSRAKRE